MLARSVLKAANAHSSSSSPTALPAPLFLLLGAFLRSDRNTEDFFEVAPQSILALRILSRILCPVLSVRSADRQLETLDADITWAKSCEQYTL